MVHRPQDDVELIAFFLDRFPGDPKRGSYTPTITETGEHADSQRAQGIIKFQEGILRLIRDTASNAKAN